MTRVRTTPGHAYRARGEHVEIAVRLIRSLLAGPCGMRELAAELGVSYRTLYRHLHGIERGLGVQIEPMREGQRVLYRLRPTAVKKALGLR